MKNFKLSDLFDMQMGKTPARNNPNYWENGIYPWISIADITTNGRFITTTKEAITNSAVYETGIKPISPGTVIMSFKLSVGKVARTTVKSYSNEAIMAFEIKDAEPSEYAIDNEYAYYLLSALNFDSVGNKAVMGKTLNKRILEDTIVAVHKWDEQRKIIAELDKINDLISFRKQQLSKLDELVKSRFVELFGEWNSNPEPLKSFLKDITYGFTNPMPDAEEGPWKVTAKDVVNGKVNYDTARKTTAQAFEELTAKSKPTVGDVLLTKDGTLGRCAVVEEDGICVNQSVAVLKCNEKILPKFLAILLQMPEYQREMLKNAGGGTIKHIYITKVVDMLIVVPTISQQIEFLSFVEQTDKSKLAIQQSLDKLETMKKALMQKYFG